MPMADLIGPLRPLVMLAFMAAVLQLPVVLGVVGAFLAATAPHYEHDDAGARIVAVAVNLSAVAAQFILFLAWQEDPPIS